MGPSPFSAIHTPGPRTSRLSVDWGDEVRIKSWPCPHTGIRPLRGQRFSSIHQARDIPCHGHDPGHGWSGNRRREFGACAQEVNEE